jgi:hypothetical protein
MSQIALPNLRASLTQASYSGVPTFGIWPQQLKSLRLMTPLAPSDITYSRLDSSEITPIALAPDAAHKLHAEHAETAEAPQTSTLSPGLRICGAMAEQHAIGGGERQRVAGRFFPGQVLRALHQLAPARGRIARTSRPASRSPRCAATARTSDRRRCIPRRRRRPDCSGRRLRRRPSSASPLSRPPRRCRTRRSRRHERDSCDVDGRDRLPSAAQTPL